MDWPVIGAVGGVVVMTGLVGFGVVALVRSGPEEAKKATPTAPLLWSARRNDAPIAPSSPASPLFPSARRSASQAYATASLPRETSPSSTQYQLFPASEPPMAAELPFTDRPVTTEQPAAPRPIVAKPTTHVSKPLAEPSARPVGGAGGASGGGGLAPKTAALTPHAPLTPPGLGLQQPVEPPRIVDRRYEGVLTPPEIMRVKASLRLTPDQEPHWRPVEAQLREIGRLQMAQVNAAANRKCRNRRRKTCSTPRSPCSRACARTRRSGCASWPVRSATPPSPR